MCTPFLEGGRGIGPLKSINHAALLKLSWNVISSNSQCSSLIKARCFRNNVPYSSYIRSSIWPGINFFIHSVMDNCSWKLGNGLHINFWIDKWLAHPIVDVVHIPPEWHKTLSASVTDFIEDHAWLTPASLSVNCPELTTEIKKVIITSSAL